MEDRDAREEVAKAAVQHVRSRMEAARHNLRERGKVTDLAPMIQVRRLSAVGGGSGGTSAR